MSLSQLIFIALGAGVSLSVIMAGAWLVHRRTGNAGWIDTTWSLGVGLVGCFAAIAPLGATWPQPRQLAVAVVAGLWSLRLGLHIAERAGASPDDPRYRALIEEWGTEAPRRLFLFLQSQAVVGIILVVAIALSAHNANPGLRFQDVLGAALLIAAIAGEAISDRQLRAFRLDPQNKGRVCDRGLWGLTRHPNYFFEWLGWAAYPLVAIDLSGHNPLGWLALAAPAIMYAVLVHASGIPPLEQHMLRSRGEAYRAYQRRTSAFFPLPPRR